MRLFIPYRYAMRMSLLEVALVAFSTALMSSDIEEARGEYEGVITKASTRI